MCTLRRSRSAVSLTLPAAYPVLASLQAIPFSIISIAVIFPITQGIGMAFSRREKALSEFGNLLGNLRAVWAAAHGWRAKNKEGKWVRLLEQYDDVGATERSARELFESLMCSLIAYFECPRWSRPYQAIPWMGGMEQVGSND